VKLIVAIGRGASATAKNAGQYESRYDLRARCGAGTGSGAKSGEVLVEASGSGDAGK
jgi:hypothetical protein